ncbi:hypothetical protein C8F01DRAFT_1258923 [Mycena amicta]|nr:hypothetical protein C8F01DRAFT_1258923 [Mycena amicta]
MASYSTPLSSHSSHRSSPPVKGRTASQLCLFLKARGVLGKPAHVNIIRFAPPLVIEETDLLRAVEVLGECLRDLDVLDEIPGDDASEVGHERNVTN